jgi:hypothetical protein
MGFKWGSPSHAIAMVAGGRIVRLQLSDVQSSELELLYHVEGYSQEEYMQFATLV